MKEFAGVVITLIVLGCSLQACTPGEEVTPTPAVPPAVIPTPSPTPEQEEAATPSPALTEEMPCVPVPGFKTYEVTATQALAGFCISYPEDWWLSEGFTRGFTAFPRQGTMEKVLVIPALPGFASMTQIKDLLIQRKAETIEGYELISVSELEVNGIPAVEHMYTVTAQGGVESVRQKFLDTYLAGDEVFKISYIAPVSDFDKYLSTYRQMVRSFRILPRSS